MARGDIKHYEVDWDKFCQFVIERWRNKIIERDVYDTGNLYRSLTYNYRGTNSLNQTVGRGSGATLKIPDMVSFSFPMYGIYADRGELNDFAKFLKSVPNAPQLNVNDVDRLTFEAAEKAAAENK